MTNGTVNAAKAFENIQEQNLERTRSNLALARVRETIGAANPAEILRWESEIANNRIIYNGGTYSGGIRIGNPVLTVEQSGALHYVDGENDFIRIHNNQISLNGGLGGLGGAGG